MNQDTWMVLEDYLNALFTSAMSSGGVLAVQPNPDGSTGLKALTRSTPPERAIFPNLAFMCTNTDEDIAGAALHTMVCYFDIGLYVKFPFNDTVDDQGEAALQALRPYQNDGSGNGLSPLLRTDVTLGGMVQWTLLKGMERYVMASDTESDRIAVALYKFETHQNLKLTF